MQKILARGFGWGRGRPCRINRRGLDALRHVRKIRKDSPILVFKKIFGKYFKKNFKKIKSKFLSENYYEKFSCHSK